MLSIGEFAKSLGLTTKTLRHYEKIGLIIPKARGDNGYRYYTTEQKDEVIQVLKMKQLGFNLAEIKKIPVNKFDQFIEHLHRKINEAQADVVQSQKKLSHLQNLLSIYQKLESQATLTPMERTLLMDFVKNQFLSDMMQKGFVINQAILERIDRESFLYDSHEKKQVIENLRQILQYAKSKKLRLGPGRGASNSSLLLYSMGYSQINPLDHVIFPERINTNKIEIHFDVQCEGGDELISFCRELQKDRTNSEISIFKLPLLDIINGIERHVGTVNDKDFTHDSPLLLDVFRKNDLNFVFLFDPESKAMWKKLTPTVEKHQSIQEYLKKINIRNFHDICHLEALYRPERNGFSKKMDEYVEAHKRPIVHQCLDKKLQKMLEHSYGCIIYHEDIIKILSFYTNWDLKLANCFRLYQSRGTKHANIDYSQMETEYLQKVPENVRMLLQKEFPMSFCLSHQVAFMNLVRMSIVLKVNYHQLYMQEIKRVEDTYGFAWDDFGYRSHGIVLMQ